MSARRPLFSVITPTYNAANTIEATLKSVLRQTVDDFEVIIVDDGSTDATMAKIETASSDTSLPVRVFHGQHRGPGAARNQGIREAHSEWVAFIDADDIWEPKKLETVSEVIRANPEVDLICHSQIEFAPGSEARRLLDPGAKYDSTQPLFTQLYRGNFLLTSGLTIRREQLINAGLFDEQMLSAQDYDLWLRISRATRPYFIREPLGQYRVNLTGITANLARRLLNTMIIAQRYRAWLPEYSDRPRQLFYWRVTKSLLEVVRVSIMRRDLKQLPKIATTFITNLPIKDKNGIPGQPN